MAIPAALATLCLSFAVAQTARASKPGTIYSVARCAGMADDEEDQCIFAHSKPYAVWRARLLRQGWKPRITNDTDIDGTKVKYSGDARDMLDAGFVEIETRTGTDNSTCWFNFKKGDYCLTIITIGELDGEPKNKYRSPTFYSETIRRCRVKKIKR